MNRNLKGLVFIIIGLAILFPQVFNKELVKILIAIFLIIFGILMLGQKDGHTS